MEYTVTIKHLFYLEQCDSPPLDLLNQVKYCMKNTETTFKKK